MNTLAMFCLNSDKSGKQDANNEVGNGNEVV
jgi:hypothetical protein